MFYSIFLQPTGLHLNNSKRSLRQIQYGQDVQGECTRFSTGTDLLNWALSLNKCKLILWHNLPYSVSDQSWSIKHKVPLIWPLELPLNLFYLYLFQLFSVLLKQGQGYQTWYNLYTPSKVIIMHISKTSLIQCPRKKEKEKKMKFLSYQKICQLSPLNKRTKSSNAKYSWSRWCD